MNCNLQKAKEILLSGSFTCVLCREDIVCTSTKSGISPMLEFISDGTDLRGFSAADKIVGKAAAMLFALAGVAEVYAPIMSEAAIDTLRRFNISASCDLSVKSIINRRGDGICPMENAVAEINEPNEAYNAILVMLKSM